jgi:hypothetical protein
MGTNVKIPATKTQYQYSVRLARPLKEKYFSQKQIFNARKKPGISGAALCKATSVPH